MAIHFSKLCNVCLALLFLSCSLTTFENAAEAQESFPPTVRREANTTWQVNGVARSPAGLPVPNTTYRVESGSFYQPMWRLRSEVLEEGPADALGKFNFSIRAREFVVAHAPGYAPTASGAPEGSYVEIELDTGRSISGRVKLPDGKPAENVAVRPVTFLCELTKYQLSEIPSQSEIIIHPQMRYRSLGFPESGEPWAVQTDADGRFTMDRLPSNCRVAVAIELAGYQSHAVWVKTPDDSNINLYPQHDLESDGFETTLKPGFEMKLSGRNESTGGLEKISRVLIQPHYVKPQDVSPFNQNVYANEPEPAVDIEATLLSTADGFDIWVEPEDDRLMGYRFHVDQIGTEGELEKTIPFRSGKLLKGTISSAVDGKPIPGVNLIWAGPDRNKWTAEGNFPKINIQTKEDGCFSIAVPECEGSLAITGGVDGFRTVDSWQWINGPQTDDTTQHFMRKITKDVLATGGPLNFELEPASEIRFHVVRPDGQAEQQAIISATATRAVTLKGGPRSAKRRETLVTDAEGNTTLTNWYSHAGWLAKARKALEDPQDPKDARNRQSLERLKSTGYPTLLESFSSSGILQGFSVIPLPELGNRDPIEVEIKLTESAAILGKVVDQDGQPMDDLKVSLARGVTSINHGSQIWETRTRADGFFMATGVLPGNDYLIILGNRDVKPLGSRLDRLQLNIKDRLRPGETHEIETIECLDCRFLRDLPELTIEGLEQPEAFDVIAKYVRQQLAKIPAEHPTFPSRSSADPIPVFIEKLDAIVLPRLQEAGKLKPGSDLELKQLTEINSLLLLQTKALNSIFGARHIPSYVNERLLEQFNQHPNAQPTLLANLETTSDDGSWRQWQELFRRSNYASTKQKARLETTIGMAQDVGDASAGHSTNDQFKAKFLTLENHLKIAEELPRAMTKTEVETLQSRVDAVRKKYQDRYDFNENNDVPESYRYNSARLQTLFERLDVFVNRLRNSL